MIAKTSSCIAIVLNSLPTDGGKFQYSLTIVEALSRIESGGKKVHLLSLNDVEWTKWCEISNAEIHYVKIGVWSRVIRKIVLFLPLGMLLWRSFNRNLHPLHKLLEKISPEIVVLPGNDNFAVEVTHRCLLPIHDLMHRYERRFPEVGDSKVYKARERHYKRVCQYANGILVDSEVGERHVRESYGYTRGRVFVLPFVAPRYVYQVNASHTNISALGLPERFIFYPAQFWKHKNHRGLLEAILILKKRNVIINAVLVGARKNEWESLQSFISDNGLGGQVTCLSYVDEETLVAVYRKAVALVMPTFFGPTNIPPLEAFALGCPVVTSGIYGIPNQLGNAALYFNPSDATEIAGKIELVWTDERLRERLVTNGRAHDESWNSIQFARELDNIIRTIIDNSQ